MMRQFYYFLLILGITKCHSANKPPEYMNYSSLEYFAKNISETQNNVIIRQLTLSETERANRDEMELKKSQSSWITILRREGDSVNFNRNWTDYRNGFGNPAGNYFIGLDRLHRLTQNGAKLLVVLRDFENAKKEARYSNFQIGSEEEKYILKDLGTYSGQAGDALKWHKGYNFTTPDQDNNTNGKLSCGTFYEGGWWFHSSSCYNAYLSGPYRNKGKHHAFGINWETWHGFLYSFAYAEMSIFTSS